MVYCPELLAPATPLSPAGDWAMPDASVRDYSDYLAFIDGTLPAMATPEVFGLHQNANIAKDQSEAAMLFDSILLTLTAAGSGGSGGDEAEEQADEEAAAAAAASGGEAKPARAPKKKARTKEETVVDLAADILAKLRPEYDLEAVGAAYPNDPRESMNTVLIQELARFNRLLAVVRSTLGSVQKAMRGLIVLSTTLEEVGTDLFLGRVPAAWRGRSYPSRKPLASYVADLLERLAMLDAWIERGAPPSFWMSGFFFTQSFVTGAAQNFARKYTVPIDDVVFEVRMLPPTVNKDTITAGPEDGVYVYGMFLDGCRWDDDAAELAESEPKALFAPAPAMWMKPLRSAELPTFPSYACPLYKTSDRRGVLATTGHSSNFVMRINMPTSQPADHWIRRGVAMLLALDV
jgi:dynein heavy chain